MPSRAKKNASRNNRKSKRAQRVAMVRHLPRMAPQPASRHQLMTYAFKTSQAESAAGIGGAWFVRLNSVYDPDSSGVGASVFGYASWAAQFLNYRVHRCTMRVQASVVSGLTQGFANVTVGAIPWQPVLPSNAQTWKTLPGNEMKGLAQSGGSPSVVSFTRTWDMARISRITKAQFLNESDYSAAIGTNPPRMIYGFVGFESVGSSTAATFSASIQLTYLVEWFNPVPVQ